MLALIGLLFVLGLAVYVMTPEERTRLAEAAGRLGRRLAHAALDDPAGCEPFRDALRERTPWPLVTLVLAAANAGVFLVMLFGPGRLSDPSTLVGWGASVGPRTTNGEWWRLVTASFVHAGIVPLVVNLVALFQLGLILERLVGHAAFAGVYLAAATLASFKSIAAHAVDVSAGASGAIFGLYGLLLACWAWTLLYRSPVTIPLVAARRLGPVAAVFTLYHLASPGLGRAAEVTGFATGLAWGVMLARGLSWRKPPALRVAALGVAAIGVAAALAGPLRGIVDVRPEIDQVIKAERRTANTYQAAVDRFRNGQLSSQAMAQLIDRAIVPDLRAARARLESGLSGRVPPEHQPLVAGAEEYFRLRDESWRLRARALANTDMRMLARAEVTERRSLAALEQLRPVDAK